MKRKASPATTPQSLQILTEQEFTAMVKQKSAPKDIAVIKGCLAEVKAQDSGYRFAISTESVDRDKDVISVRGWDLAQYKQNPVVLWAHDYKALPIGTTKSLSAGGTGLLADMEFVPKEVYPFAGTVQEMVKLGILRAASVGFKPLEYSYNEERKGVDVSKSELLEWSIVPVPANSECLVQMGLMPKGLCDEFAEECERMLAEIKGKGMWVVGDLGAKLEALSEKVELLAIGKAEQPSVGDSHVGYPGCSRMGGCPTNAQGSPDNCQMADCPLKQANILPPDGQAALELGDAENVLKLSDEGEHLIGISLADIDQIVRDEVKGYVKGLVLEQMTAQFNYLLGRID